MFSRLSVAEKAALSCMVGWLAVSVVQGLGIVWVVREDLPGAWARGVSEAGAWFWISLLTAVLWVAPLPPFLTWLWTRIVTRRRTARFTRVLDRIASGELRGELEPSLDADLVVVRQALDRMQRALESLTARLTHADAQRRRLFGDLAHELATPIGTILAISEALARPLAAEDENNRRSLVVYLDREAARLERLIDDMRDLSELDDPAFSIARTSTNVAALARELTALPREGASVEVDALDAWAEVDRVRIEQVFANLLSNARRYTQPEGRIVVTVRDEAAGVAVTVDDDGDGVPEGMLSHLGERMLRLDPSRSTRTGGHGLGLSIVRAVVHQHGGEVRFERAPIGGLRARIFLPRTARECVRPSIGLPS